MDSINSFITPEMGKEIGIGTVAGIATGYTLKQLSKMLALAIGTGFIGIQVARSKGWLTPNWDKMQEGMVQACDMDGDGKFTPADIQVGTKKLLDYLGFGLPSATSFVAGFYLGIKL